MALLIKNGEIITASERYVADILCTDETITAIGTDLPEDPDVEVIDATGKYVFPGFIDPHTHIYLPFMGTFAKDTYETASKAALIGGTTCFIDFCIPDRGQDPLAALDIWNAQSDGNSACDFTYHLAVTAFDDRIEKQLRQAVTQHGLTSFKVFLAYKGALGVTDEELYHTLRVAKELGVITTAHCENPDLVLEMQNKLIAEGKTGPEWHYHSRPPLIEAEGTGHLMTFAEVTGAHVYVVHLSCEEALDEAMRAKRRGVSAWVETLIQYLVLDMSYAEKPNFEGAKYVMSPPLRDKRNQDVLWNGLKHRLISTLATDHAPFDFEGQKRKLGADKFTTIPNGIPSLEERVNLLFTHGVKTGRLDLQTFVDCASTQAAKIFGLYPRKGTIQLGCDADLVVYDPNYKGTISVNSQTMNLDYSAFEGWPIEGRPSVVTVRGEVAVRDGAFVGTVGRGRRLEREPNH
ncbi:MAG: dihydropyrimidinase [Verrucomicrobia bacterium]|nr:dihydropyrimidinase [Verrucomicrobiota bacterium]